MQAFPSPIFDSLSGSSFGRRSSWHTRHLKRSGKTIICRSGNPNQSGAELRRPWQNKMAVATRQYWIIMKDPTLLAPYQAAYSALPRHQRDQLTLRQYIYRQLLQRP